MANTITVKDLQAVVDRINRVTGSPMTEYTYKHIGVKGELVANIGNYHLSSAYGGYALHRMCNTGGGTANVNNSGYVTKRALYDLLHMYLAGYNAGKGETV